MSLVVKQTPVAWLLGPRQHSNVIFADPRTAKFLGSAVSLNSIPRYQGLPEVVLTGRANSGKSTLVNLILGRRNLVRTGKKAGQTKSLNFFSIGGKLIVVDAPGYGARGRVEWGSLFDQYLESREPLRRVYILINAKHGLTHHDSAMLSSLDARCQASSGLKFTIQAIITKMDTVPPGEINNVKTMLPQQIFDVAPTCLPPILTSAKFSPAFGIDDLRKSIIEACGVERTKVGTP